MKKKVLSLVIVAAFASNAYATNEQDAALLPGIVASAQTQAVDVTPALNALDLQAAFQQDKQPMQVAALSGQEMKATEGAFWWFFVPIVVRATPIAISFLAGTGGTMTIPMWTNRARMWW